MRVSYKKGDMKKGIHYVLILTILCFAMSSCVVIRPGEIAVKQRVGKLVGEPVTGGIKAFNPFVATYVKVPGQIINKKIDLDIPSKEGLTIRAEVSILYRVDPKLAKTLISSVGVNFEEDLITPVFRSALADVSARFMAKDMHTGERASIEKAVQEMMLETLESKGIIVERVLMKRIILPKALSDAIEEKLTSEQEAQRMAFVLQREKQEAERKKIEAKGIAESQEIISSGLTDEILRFKTIEAFQTLSTSENAKIILKGDNIPMILAE